MSLPSITCSLTAIGLGLLATLPVQAAPGAVSNAISRQAPQASSLQLDVSPRAHVFFEPKPWQPTDPAPNAAGVAPARASLGVGFRTAPGGAAGVKGLLKVQLSGDSVLHFRPRGGGMTVTYKSQF